MRRASLTDGGRSSDGPPSTVYRPIRRALLWSSQIIAMLALWILFAGKIDWPGKPAPRVDVLPLTDEQQRRFTAGAELYKNICVGCHQADGRGREKLAPDLVDSRFACFKPHRCARSA